MAILAEEKNLGAAFGLTCMAGASTVIGASVVFFPKLVKRASPRVLAASLGLSAGVMVYLSFVEVFIKSVNKFVSSGAEEGHAYFYATLSFFGGVSMMKVSIKLNDRIRYPYWHNAAWLQFSVCLLYFTDTDPDTHNNIYFHFLATIVLVLIGYRNMHQIHK